MVKDLKYRLKKFVPPLEGVAFEYGFNTNEMDTWVNYWADKYNFSEREKFVNQFPHFKTNIQGLDIHFIRVTPKVPKDIQVVPLLLMHGWGGSVREFYEAIPMLTKPMQGYNFVFDVIAPSIPGFGFSDAPVRPGLAFSQEAVIYRNLMNRLGFKKYYLQGDMGAAIGNIIAILFPEDILGYHSNFLVSLHTSAILRTLVGAVFPSLIVENHLADRMYPLSEKYALILEETGYMHMHATKPDTLGTALTDTPAGFLAYMLEKFSVWPNMEYKHRRDGGLSENFTKDQLLDNFMIYWSTNSITTSIRFYAENLNKKGRGYNLDNIPTPVPTWALQAKNELIYQPQRVLEVTFLNLVNVTVLDDGGHFLALQMPKVFTEDVFRAVKAFREFHKSNQAKTEL